MNPWAFGCLPSAGRRFRRPVVSVRGRRCADILKNEKKRKYYFSALGLSAEFCPSFPDISPSFPEAYKHKKPASLLRDGSSWGWRRLRLGCVIQAFQPVQRLLLFLRAVLAQEVITRLNLLHQLFIGHALVIAVDQPSVLTQGFIVA